MPAEQSLLLSVDFEDWHQLVRRRIGASSWREPGPALARQTQALLTLLDELSVTATFFVLGMAARAHPELLEAVVVKGHEIGCHGDAHLPVHAQSPAEFAADLRKALKTIEAITGQRPVGFRAPAFSINRQATWAFEVLAEEGFAYDSSLHDTPRIQARAPLASNAPHRLALPGGVALYEFPIAVWRRRYARVPVGGASYWAVMPTKLIVEGLAQAGDYAALYLHPQELDPKPLRVGLPAGSSSSQRARAAVRELQRNTARRRAPDVLRAIAERSRLIPYRQAYAHLDAGAGARPQPVPR